MSLQDATNFHIQVAPMADLMPVKEQKSIIKYVLENQKLRVKEDMRTLRMAIDSASNTTSYNREMLHRIYREVMRDPNLSGQWESRKMKTKEKQFKILRGEAENTDLTDLFERDWFLSWIDACLESKMWGFSLVEFGPMMNNDFFPYMVDKKMQDAINIIDRDNVKPELGVITSSPGEFTGISFFDPKYTDNLMFVGKTKDWGMLYKLVKYIMFKDNCLNNWSEWAEVFGMDKRVGYTDAQDRDRTNFIEAMKNLGSNAYGVFSTTDKVEFLGTNRTDAYQVYNSYVQYVDEQVSKCVWGQDVVNNNTGKVVGTVGENVADMYGANDARFIKYLVNYRLFPFLKNLGFQIPEGAIFTWDTAEKLSLKDKAVIDASIARDMGMDINEKYITDTYGVPVTKTEVPDPVKNAGLIRNLYKDA